MKTNIWMFGKWSVSLSSGGPLLIHLQRGTSLTESETSQRAYPDHKQTRTVYQYRYEEFACVYLSLTACAQRASSKGETVA